MKKLSRKTFNFLFYILLMQLIYGVSHFFPNLKFFNKIRGWLLSPFFAKCGKNFQIAKGVTINMSRNIYIGDNVYIAHKVWINGTGKLYIDNGVIVSPNVVITTTKHQYKNGAISNVLSENKPTKIGKGSWIASNSTITMGIEIGKGVIVGANSVVLKDIDDYSLAAGCPAKVIKKLEV